MGWVIQSPYSLKEWVRSFDDEYLGNSAGKEFACNAGDPGSIPGSGSSSGEGLDYLLQYSCLENLHGQMSLVGYSPWGHKRVRHDLVTKQQQQKDMEVT